MAVELPNLDNRTYDELLAEARASIHLSYRGWTDHNPSDPGITLIELFAWLTEMILYRTNRITDQGYDVFLKILRSDPAWQRPSDVELHEAVKETIGALRERYRAVTPDDYEQIVMAEWSASVRRARCLAERDLEPFTGELRRPGHVSVILVPEPVDFYLPFSTTYTEADFAAAQQPTPSLLSAVKGALLPRRVLTTRVHVVGPTYFVVPLTAKLYLREGFTRAQVTAAALAALQAYFHPITGGADGAGWPFGRPVYTSDIYALLDAITGVDFVTDVDLPVALENRKIIDGPSLVGVDLLEHELPRISVTAESLTVFERAGGVWL